MDNSIFDSSYTEYWQKAVEKSVDGTKIAGQEEVAKYFQILKIEKVNRILDAGCSYGRMFELLQRYGLQVDGIEPDPYALKKAKLNPYSELLQGSCESTGLPEDSYDLIFSWAVFDVVNQSKSLQEMNRVLKIGGHLLFTGKNDNYRDDDKLAFIAERNAFRKKFPNQFTNLPSLFAQMETLGFKLRNLLIFEKRGDTGEMKYKQIQDIEVIEVQAYEYLLVLEKIANIKSEDDILPVASKFSQTVARKCLEAGFDNIEKYLLLET